MAVALRFAARSDVGLLRQNNQDSAYAGPRLLVVADGMGGHVGGDVASSVAVATLSPLDEESAGPDLLDRLAKAVEAANETLRDMMQGDPALAGMGTTLTALLRSGSRLGLVHVGDSRCYLLRDGELQQLTRDDTFVQTLVDEGRITAEEAGHHPQRSMITNALQGGGSVDMHLSVREARVGDRYLLCSDGLSGVVSEETLRDTLGKADADIASDALVQLALRGGGPDNITVIVADVVDVDAAPSDIPAVVGSAAVRPARPGARTSGGAAAKAAALRPDDDPPEDARVEQGSGPRWLLRTTVVALVIALVGGLGWGAYAWSQEQYYVAAQEGQVAIFRGLSQQIGPVDLSSPFEVQDLAIADLPVFTRTRIQDGVPADDLDNARLIVDQLRADAALCATPEPATAPTPTASTAPGASATPEPGATAAPTPPVAPTPTPDPTVTPFSLGPGAPAIDCGEVR
jgi:serine/threonine protein phosphatase PrpC